MRQDIAEKNKELEEELAKIESKYKVEEDIKKDEKGAKKGDRQKKKEKEKAKLKEKIEKITEGDLMKVLEFLDPKIKPKITEVRDMIWVRTYITKLNRKWMRTWTNALISQN